MVKAVRRAKLWGIFLICLAVMGGGCGIQEPQLTPEAQALKKEMLGEINSLTDKLIDPVSKEDWQATTQILQESYQGMKKEGKVVSSEMVILDRNGIARVRFPSKLVKHFDFSNYKLAKTVFNKKRKVQGVFYFKGVKIFVLVAPLLQKGKVIGGVALVFPEGELEKKWKVSEEEFMSIDFNK